MPDNLDHLELDPPHFVSLRVGRFDSPTPGSISEPFAVLALHVITAHNCGLP